MVAATLATTTLQVPLAASEPPVNEIVLGEVVVREPPQVVVGPLLATVRPAGRVSVNAMPLSAVPALGFVNVNVRVDVPLTAMAVGANALVSVGADGAVRL